MITLLSSSESVPPFGGVGACGFGSSFVGNITSGELDIMYLFEPTGIACTSSPFLLWYVGNSNLKNLEDYICPFWNKQDDSGCFDESGYEIDHIEEHCINGNDSPENLQALCKCCHIVKTKRFMMSCSK